MRIQCLCELCGKPTGTEINLGDLDHKIPGLDRNQNQYAHGICPVCQGELDSGCTFFCDSQGRVVKVSKEATMEKIQPEFHGKVVRIPRSALSVLIEEYQKVNPPN